MILLILPLRLLTIVYYELLASDNHLKKSYDLL